MSTISVAGELEKSRGLDYRTVWRWHFYAGLFCIPFVLWLSVTGTIFLFHPQIQHWLDRPYDHLSITQPETANAQVKAALAAVPGSTWTPMSCHTPPRRRPRSWSIGALSSSASMFTRRRLQCYISTMKTTELIPLLPACMGSC
jgi:uncharacterized iron-regulated membrane protein